MRLEIQYQLCLLMAITSLLALMVLGVATVRQNPPSTSMSVINPDDSG